jgi:predicted N-formylglutamate amidohydrolase
MAAYSCPEPCRLLVTCEHGGNLVPRSLRHLFNGREEILETHLAHDPGALEIAAAVARFFEASFFYAVISRLVIDCNRSPSNFRIFSPVTRSLGKKERARLLYEYHQPYHHAIRREVMRLLAGRARLIHVAVHTFVPRLHGRSRHADIGLLYDPARAGERQFCSSWRNRLRELEPSLRVKRNFPYLGRADGLPTMLRKTYPDTSYWAIELEIGQAALSRYGRGLTGILTASLHLTLQDAAGGMPSASTDEC